MLNGIRLIASAAARSVRAGGCAPRPAHPAAAAGQRNLVGFIRCLSASSTSKDEPGRKIRMTYEDVVQALKAGPLMRGIEVDVYPNNVHECYLDTDNFYMRYKTQQLYTSYGNVSLNWIFTPHPADKSAVLLSNYVTQKANESGVPPGTFETYCTNGSQLMSGEYNIHMVGFGVKFYFEVGSGSSSAFGLYTYLNEEPPITRYYLQTTVGSNNLIVKTGDPQYIFGIVPPQPLPAD